MSDKLHELCQLQLGSIVADLEKSVGGVNAAASKIMQSVNDSKLEKSATPGSECAFTNAVGDEVKNIIMGLQFHDELTQRLEHLQTLLHLLEELPRKTKNEQEDNEKLLSKVKKIFSSNAEFNQLEKVFPGCEVVSTSDAIELF